MSKLAYIVRHINFENAGILESVLVERGFELTYIEAPLANFEHYDAKKADLVIVCGAPIGAYDEKLYPFLTDEIKFITDRINSKKPLLGICLGAQLISRIMGGHVGPMKHGKKEIGFSPIEYTTEGASSPLALLGNVPVLHWHGDEFEIPRSAVRLAKTELCQNQAFSVDTHILALQFHMEADPTLIESWLVGHCAELSNAGIDICKLRDDAKRLRQELPAAGKAACIAWLEQNHL